jgi:aspartate/methionine/tyrosine aminotransferase
MQPQSYIYEPHPKGHLQTRKAITAYYRKKGIHLDPESIFLTSSTSEAYSFIFRLITNPEDSILVPQPSYPLFNFLADLNDVKVATYPLIYENGWHIDLESLQSSIKKNARAIVVVNPNNPTGSYVSTEELHAIIALAKENNLILISDEVFFDYTLVNHSKKIQNFAGISAVLTFTLNGLSKMLGLPQMKLAWIAVNGPSTLLNETLARLEVITDTYLSVNAPIQIGLPRIMRYREKIQQQIKKRLSENLNFFKNKLENFPFLECFEVQAGWYVILKVPRIKSDEEWALELLEKEGVWIHPGHFYNFNEDGYLVISLLTLPEVFHQGIEKIFSYISQQVLLE